MFKNILRIMIGLIFILSGMVKAIDVVGFSFKLEEYFSPQVFNLEFLSEYSLILAVFVVAFEVILGAMLVLGIQILRVLYWLIALCIFFAFLTFYSAYFDKVTDCGCFGDAIKFTPWQSFWKDIILLLGLLFLLFLYKRNYQKSVDKISIFVLFVFSIFSFVVIIWGMISEPLIDFRDYKIGTDISKEKEKITQDPSLYKVFYGLKNSKTGEEKFINQDEYINNEIYWKEGTPWQIDSTKTQSKLVYQGYKTEISKFKIESPEGEDLTPKILSENKAVLIFSYRPKELSQQYLNQIKEKFSKTKNALVLVITPGEVILEKIPTGYMDATAIKTIARSNPFVLVLEKGKIIEKKPLSKY